MHARRNGVEVDWWARARSMLIPPQHAQAGAGFAACNSVANKLGSRVEASLKFKPIAQFAAGMRAIVLLATDPNPTRHGAPKAKRGSRKSA